MIKKLALLFVMLFSMTVLAQAVVSPDQEFLDLLVKSLGGVKGLQTWGLIGLGVQLLMKFMDTSYFNKWVPVKVISWKLPAVSFLSIVGGVITLVSVEKLSFGAALIHSTTLSAIMVFAHQWLLWFKPKNSDSKIG